jgi:hypothetical protein
VRSYEENELALLEKAEAAKADAEKKAWENNHELSGWKRISGQCFDNSCRNCGMTITVRYGKVSKMVPCCKQPRIAFKRGGLPLE